MKKIIVRIKGGLGNQLFCYAAARRLALVNDAELVIDDVTGFVRDKKYRRKYMLDHFNISARKATPSERLEPFERYRRAILKWLSHIKPFEKRKYIEQEQIEFDKRLLSLKFKSSIYLDGLWQSEKYFQDIKDVIYEDLQIIPPADRQNRDMAKQIADNMAVAVHFRWFDTPGIKEQYNLPDTYYQQAIRLIERKIDHPHYFVFSDNIKAARKKIVLPKDRSTYIAHNISSKDAYADLWLMMQCKHFIIANSTFSWWGAWLSKSSDKIVVCPKIRILNNQITLWNFSGQLPDRWLKI